MHIKNVSKDKRLVNHISNNLKQLLKRTGISINQLSQNTGLSFTTIKRLIEDDDTNPTLDSLNILADYFSLSVQELITENGGFNNNSLIYSKSNNIRLIPILDNVQIIEWPNNKSELTQNDQINSIHTDSDLSNDAFAMVVTTSLMEPAIPEKSIVIVDPEANLINDCFIVIRRKDETIPQIKQLLLDGPDKYIRSLNTSLLSNQTSLLIGKDYCIVGVIKEVIKKL